MDRVREAREMTARLIGLVTVLVVLVVAGAAAPARGQGAVSAYIDNNVAGDVQSGRVGLGISAGYYVRGRIGLELDGELHGHFFRDQDVADLQPAGVDLNTSAALGTANLVVPYCMSGKFGIWCPYANLGAGMIHTTFKGTAHAPGAQGFDRSQTDLAFDGGVGVMHALTRWIGLRIDARYFRAFVDTKATGGFDRDYGYWRISVGVVFGGPLRALVD
jgi:hypothetical protein